MDLKKNKSVVEHEVFMKSLEKRIQANHSVEVSDLTSDELKELQSSLAEIGYYTDSVDGIYGENTRQALAKFKEDSFLEYPSLIGESTINILQDALEKEDEKPKKREGTVAIAGLSYKVNLTDSILEDGHFTWNEATHGGTRLPQHPDHTQNIIRMATRLENVRSRLGNKPMTITSWYRPEPYNRRAGGASKSEHKTGKGVDFVCPGETGRTMARKLSDWSGGMGIYNHFPNILHLDIRPYRARWGGA